MAPASALTPPPRLKPTDEIVNTTTKAQPARDRKLTDHPLKTAAPSHENVHAGTILLSRRRPAFARSDGKQAVWPSRYSHAMKIGVAVGGTLQEVSSLARKAEAAGLESVWLAELDRTALVQAAAAILATSRIGVGTAVALAFPRSPTVTAMTAWDLDEMSGDRFMLGLGPQVKRVLEARFSVRVDKPAPQMREYVQAVRTVWAANRGEAVIHEGDAYRITMPTFHGPARPERRDTPILLAAVGPAMSRVCGDRPQEPRPQEPRPQEPAPSPPWRWFRWATTPTLPGARPGFRSRSTPRRPRTRQSWLSTTASRCRGTCGAPSSTATSIAWPN
jgi:hypothetical protein